jgi:hypothetical protein
VQLSLHLANMYWTRLLASIASLTTLQLEVLAGSCWRDTTCNGPTEAAFEGTYFYSYLSSLMLTNQGPGKGTSTPHHHVQFDQDQSSLFETVIQQATLDSWSSAGMERMLFSISV